MASLPRNKVTDVSGYQLLKAGTSIGANYREANRAVSRDDFINKIGIVEKEAAESEYWLELFDETDIGDPTERRWLLQEAGELLGIFTSIGKATRSRRSKPVLRLSKYPKSEFSNPKSEIRNSERMPTPTAPFCRTRPPRRQRGRLVSFVKFVVPTSELRPWSRSAVSSNV